MLSESMHPTLKWMVLQQQRPGLIPPMSASQEQKSEAAVDTDKRWAVEDANVRVTIWSQQDESAGIEYPGLLTQWWGNGVGN